MSRKQHKPHSIGIKWPYYYVEKCPVCGSPATGRIIREPASQRDYVMIKSLENGELVIMDPDPSPTNNLFCIECGNQWTGDAKLTMLTKTEIARERKIRGTDAMLTAYKEAHNIKDDPKKHSMIRGWFGFLNP